MRSSLYLSILEASGIHTGMITASRDALESYRKKPRDHLDGLMSHDSWLAVSFDEVRHKNILKYRSS